MSQKLLDGQSHAGRKSTQSISLRNRGQGGLWQAYTAATAGMGLTLAGFASSDGDEAVAIAVDVAGGWRWRRLRRSGQWAVRKGPSCGVRKAAAPKRQADDSGSRSNRQPALRPACS